jgi:hypothetical protein
MLLGRELHNQEGKGLKEGENVVDAKSLQLDSPITDGTQTQTYTHILIYTFWHCAVFICLMLAYSIMVIFSYLVYNFAHCRST